MITSLVELIKSSLDIYQPKPNDGKNPNLSDFANLSEPLYPKLNSEKYLSSKAYVNLPETPKFLYGKDL